MIKLYSSPSCTSCRKAKAWFEDYNLEYEERNIFQDQLSHEELKMILSMTENGTEDIISTRSKAFKQLDINIDDLTLKELFDVLDDHPSIIRRPIIMDEKHMQVGFNENEIRRFLPRKIRDYELEKAKLEAGVN